MEYEINIENEIYYNEIIEQQQEIIELLTQEVKILEQGFNNITSLIGVIIGIIVIITFIRGVFRHVGN